MKQECMHVIGVPVGPFFYRYMYQESGQVKFSFGCNQIGEVSGNLSYKKKKDYFCRMYYMNP